MHMNELERPTLGSVETHGEHDAQQIRVKSEHVCKHMSCQRVQNREVTAQFS